jgi:uncharacterized membrane protein YedE/YeeE
MMAAFPHAMPIQGLIGGVLIGLASALMLLGLGRIAGVSGLAARATGIADSGAPRGLAIAFIIGLPLGAWVITGLVQAPASQFPSFAWLVAGGVLVGFGTRLGSGCTSGHGVCGLSRLSPRSLVATILFMAAGFATATLLHVFL